MPEQNFGNRISERYLEILEFDFFSNSVNKFKDRAKIYNQLMKKVVSDK